MVDINSLRKHYEKIPQSFTEMFHKRPSEIVVSHGVSGYITFLISINALLISCKYIESAQKTREWNTDTSNVFLNAISCNVRFSYLYLQLSLHTIAIKLQTYKIWELDDFIWISSVVVKIFVGVIVSKI